VSFWFSVVVLIDITQCHILCVIGLSDITQIDTLQNVILLCVDVLIDIVPINSVILLCVVLIDIILSDTIHNVILICVVALSDIQIVILLCFVVLSDTT
jgi:hypothetical protein